ncbi:MAG: hypothetical protein WC492_05120 [Candidatus Micrarchaeia archaeon]
MYHPGRVIEVLKAGDKEVDSADESTQATLDMWDENILTFTVSKKLEAKIKTGQIVLVDYRPDEKFKTPVPIHEIVKIISGKKALKVWNTYRDMFERKKRKAENIGQQPAQSYIG